jgi:hypothetical protein
MFWMMVPTVVLELLFIGCQLYVTKYDSLALSRLRNSPYLHCIVTTSLQGVEQVNTLFKKYVKPHDIFCIVNVYDALLK